MILGAHVQHRVLDGDEPGKSYTRVALEGVVVAIERGGGEFTALVMLKNGDLVSIRAELLTVVELANGVRPDRGKADTPAG